MYLGMAFISLIINLSLDYFKENAHNLRREIINVIEEKVTFFLSFFLSVKLFRKIN